MSVVGPAASPLPLFEEWFAAAAAAGERRHDAVCVATVGSDGRPSARIVLFKGLNHGGFVFFTNYESRKGRDLSAHPYASMVFYWETLHRQVRVDGQVERTSREESDVYWESRPRGSQLSAAASQQSERIRSREELEIAVGALDRQFEGVPVPRPDHWGGYRLIPDRIEFWQGARDRLHHRILYTLSDGQWSSSLLAP